MKKTTKKLLALCMVVAMLTGLATTAFAASGTTINLISVEGYLNDAVSLSNVVGTASKSYSKSSPTYICNSPAEIKLLIDLPLFFVARREVVNDRLVSVGEELPINGQITFWDNSIGGERTVDHNDLENYNAVYSSLIRAGSKVTLTEKGIYYVQGRIGEPNDLISVYIIVDDEVSAPVPTSSKVAVRDQHSVTPDLTFDAYNIGGNNYFKLRDLAYVLNGSAKQFEVEWNGANNAILLTSNAAYTPVGGEMEVKGVGNKIATPTSSKILLNGKEIILTAYNIGGNNYFKLRDIGQAFDFGVKWDGINNRIIITTSTGYTSE
jgi:hypothetical protein